MKKVLNHKKMKNYFNKTFEAGVLMAPIVELFTFFGVGLERANYFTPGVNFINIL